MNQLLRLFDLFNKTAKNMAGYLPQSGSDLLVLLKKLLILAGDIDVWIINTVGVDLKIILSAIGKIVMTGVLFLVELISRIAGRL